MKNKGSVGIVVGAVLIGLEVIVVGAVVIGLEVIVVEAVVIGLEFEHRTRALLKLL